MTHFTVGGPEEQIVTGLSNWRHNGEVIRHVSGLSNPADKTSLNMSRIFSIDFARTEVVTYLAYASTMKMEAVRYSETSLNFYQTKRFYMSQYFKFVHCQDGRLENEKTVV
jgi:hypothetical protein